MNVNPALVAGAITFSSTLPIASGSTVILTAHPSSGSGTGYSYKWYTGSGCSGTAISSATANTYTTPSLTNDATYSYQVTDSVGGTACASGTVTVALAAGAITPASPTIDSGMTETLTAHPSGGSGTYSSYQWWLCDRPSCASGVPINGATSSTYTTPPLTSTSFYEYYVTDSTGSIAYSVGDTVTVNPPLTAGAITPASPTITGGSTQKLTAHPSGGMTPYGYQWFSLAGGVAPTCTPANELSDQTANTYTTPSTLPGTTTYSYNVIDSFGFTSCSSGDTVTVTYAVSVSPSPVSVDYGATSVTLTATPLGGVSPYTYQWYTGSGCPTGSAITSGGASSTYTTPSSLPIGTATYSVETTDHSGTSECGSGNVIVHSGLSASSITATPSSVETGVSSTLAVVAAGGTSPYTYSWYLGPCTGSSVGSGASYSVSTETPGTYAYNCLIGDTAHTPSSYCASSATVTVTPPPLFPPTITPATTTLDSGQSVTLSFPLTGSGSATGGTPPYTYQWYTGAGCPSGGAINGATSSTYTAQSLLQTGTTTYSVEVTDHAEAYKCTPDSAAATVVVDSAPSASTPSSTTVYTGAQATLTSTVSGGTGYYSWTWYNSIGTALQTGTGSTATLAFYPASSESGFYVVFKDTGTTADVSPSSETVQSPTASVTVHPTTLDPGLIIPSSPIIDDGQSIILTASASQGNGAYTYKWYAGQDCNTYTGYSSSSPAYAVSPSGTTIYSFKVTDKTGATVCSSISSSYDIVTVNPALSFQEVPSSQTLTSGQSATLTAKLSTGVGTGPFSWQWYNNGVPISTAGASGTGASATYTFTATSTTSFFYVVFTDTGVSVLATPAATISSASAGEGPCGLLPASIAQTISYGEPWYCPINAQIYAQWSSILPIAVVVVALAFSIAALIVMVGIAFKSNRIRDFGIAEMYEAIASAIIVGAFIYVCAVMFGITPGIFVGGINPYSTALWLMSNTTTQAQNLFSSVFDAQAWPRWFLTQQIEIDIEGVLLPIQQLFAFALLPVSMFVIDPARAISFFLADGIIALYTEYYLIVFFSVAAIPAFIIPGVVFRTFLPTRALGGVMLAMGISFYLVMPTMFAVVYYFTSPTLQSTMANEYGQLSRFSTGTSSSMSSIASPDSPLALQMQDVQGSMAQFWLLVLFYPALIITVTYATIQQLSSFIGGSYRNVGKVRGFI